VAASEQQEDRMISKRMTPSVPQIRRLLIVVLLGWIVFLCAKANMAGSAPLSTGAPATRAFSAERLSPFGQSSFARGPTAPPPSALDPRPVRG
jgi:hypothetical protein